MKWTLTILMFLLLLPSPMSGQETKVEIFESGAMKVIGCTNGGHLRLEGEVRVAIAIHTCIDSSCKETSPDELATGANIPSGKQLFVFCRTSAEDELSARDLEFCKNNVSNPHPSSVSEGNKWNAEISQCLKDRGEHRRQKEH
jgi:hypothetical protein